MKTQEQHHTQIEKKIIAGEGEKAQYLVHEQNDNTVRFAVRYPVHLSAERLKQATGAIVYGIDVLHASFEPKPLEAVWVVHKEVDESDYFSLIQTEQDVMSVADSVLIQPVLPEEKVQMHCTLIQGTDDCALVLRISHLCVDGGDGKYLLEKLIEAYHLLAQDHTAEKLELKNGSRSAFQIYKGLSAKEYLSAVKPDMPTEKTTFPFPENGGGYPQIVRRTIDPAVMQDARHYGKKRNATINDLILTSFSRAYVRLPGADRTQPVNIMSMMDLRRYCKNGDSAGLSNMPGSMSTVVQIGQNERFEETLEKIAAQTQRQKESPIAGLNGLPIIQNTVKHVPMGMALKFAGKVYGSNMPVGMTNLGNFSGTALALEGARPTELVFGGPSKKKNGMQISAAGLDGVVTLCCVGEYGNKDAEQIALFLAYMEEELKTAVGDPQ